MIAGNNKKTVHVDSFSATSQDVSGFLNGRTSNDDRENGQGQ